LPEAILKLRSLAQEHRLLGLGMAFLLTAVTLWLVHQQCGLCQQVCILQFLSVCPHDSSSKKA
jgi:hypothetical protein